MVWKKGLHPNRFVTQIFVFYNQCSSLIALMRLFLYFVVMITSNIGLFYYLKVVTIVTSPVASIWFRLMQ